MTLSRFRTDLRDAVRGLRTGRGTILLAFVILTLAMGAGTVTFSVVDAVALRQLPYTSPERLVGICRPGVKPGTLALLSPAEYFLLIDNTRTFDSLAASRPA